MSKITWKKIPGGFRSADGRWRIEKDSQYSGSNGTLLPAWNLYEGGKKVLSLEDLLRDCKAWAQDAEENLEIAPANPVSALDEVRWARHHMVELLKELSDYGLSAPVQNRLEVIASHIAGAENKLTTLEPEKAVN